jgi:hypothetical protein
VGDVTSSSHSITVRVPIVLYERLTRSVERGGVTQTAWVLEAIMWALERDEAPHVPEVVKAAMPRRVGTLMAMPEGVTRPGDW